MIGWKSLRLGRSRLARPRSSYSLHMSRARGNPLIAGVFYRRGLIERWGRGTLKMAELTAAAGLPRPEIEDAADCVTVRFRPSRYVPPQRVSANLTDRQQAVLALLHRAGSSGLALREILRQLESSPNERTIQRDLTMLRDLELVVLLGHGRSARWQIL